VNRFQRRLRLRGATPSTLEGLKSIESGYTHGMATKPKPEPQGKVTGLLCGDHGCIAFTLEDGKITLQKPPQGK
jgi:hypothetical protein